MGDQIIAYLDCYAGMTPALILGALLDIGLDRDALGAELAVFPWHDWGIAAQQQTSVCIAGQYVTFTAPARDLD